MVIGQTYSTDTFDITITGFDFSEKAENPNGDNHLAPGDGRVTANVYYNIKFTGKAQSPGSVFAPESLRYGDGYVFDPVEFWFYKERSDGWLNIGDVQPLDPEFPCKACFFVPEEVEKEKGNPSVRCVHGGSELFSPAGERGGERGGLPLRRGAGCL